MVVQAVMGVGGTAGRLLVVLPICICDGLILVGGGPMLVYVSVYPKDRTLVFPVGCACRSRVC